MPVTSARSLIVNADDFGRSPGVNCGVMHAHEHGIVTSASLMVRWPAAQEAARWCRDHPSLSVGLHLDLGEWIYRHGRWEVLYGVVATDDPVAVRTEVTVQLERFENLLRRPPTHLDSHQHVHLHEPVRTALCDAGTEAGVPVRDHTAGIRYSGAFYGQSGRGKPWPSGVTLEHLLDIIDALPPGITELGCHPGLGDDFESVYLAERTHEVAVLCDARVRRALDDRCIALKTFADVTDVVSGTRQA